MRRWESLSGAVGLAIVFLALFLPGPPPKTEDTAAVLTATLIDQRPALVRGMLLAGVGLMLLLWFFGVLGARLANAEGRVSAAVITAVSGGLIGVAFMFIGMLLFSGAAFRAASMGDDALVRSVVDTGNMVIETSKYGFGVLIVFTCAAAGASSFLTRRMMYAGVVSAVVLVVSTVPPFIVDRGFGQFGGGIDVVGGVPGFVWILAVSVVMTRREDVARPGETRIAQAGGSG